MRDQTRTYESAGESAKQLALHLCGKKVVVWRAQNDPPDGSRQKGRVGSPLPAAISNYDERLFAK